LKTRKNIHEPWWYDTIILRTYNLCCFCFQLYAQTGVTCAHAPKCGWPRSALPTFAALTTPPSVSTSFMGKMCYCKFYIEFSVMVYDTVAEIIIIYCSLMMPEKRKWRIISTVLVFLFHRRPARQDFHNARARCFVWYYNII